MIYRQAGVRWKGRSAEEFLHVGIGAIFGYLIAIVLSTVLGNVIVFNLATALTIMVISMGVAWLLDAVGVARAIPGKLEYILYCGLGVALFNAIATSGFVPLDVVDVLRGLIPKDPMAVIRGFAYGAAGGFLVYLMAAVPVRLHGGGAAGRYRA